MEQEIQQSNLIGSIQRLLKAYRAQQQISELALLTKAYETETIPSIDLYCNGWIIQTAVEDRITTILHNSKVVMLVGSGVIPYSLIHLNRWNLGHKKKLLGLERNSNIVKISRKLIEDLRIPNIFIIEGDGRTFDYSKYLNEGDLIYISSDVINTSKVIKQVWDSGCKAKTYICLPRRKKAPV